MLGVCGQQGFDMERSNRRSDSARKLSLQRLCTAEVTLFGLCNLVLSKKPYAQLDGAVVVNLPAVVS